MTITFTYKNKNKQLFISVLLLLSALTFVGLGTAFLVLSFSQDSTDRFIFLTVALPFLGAGIAFSVFSTLRFIRIRRFFQSRMETGFFLQAQQLKITSFNYWKVKHQLIDLSPLLSVEMQSNRGQRYLIFRFHHTKKPEFVSVQHCSIEDVQLLITAIRNIDRRPAVIPVENTNTTASQPISTSEVPSWYNVHVQLLTRTLIEQLAKQFNCPIDSVISVQQPNELRIGSSGQHQLLIQNVGHEGYTGGSNDAIEVQIVFTLKTTTTDQESKPLRFSYHYEISAQAGSTSYFSSNLPQEEQDAFEQQFYVALRKAQNA